MLRAPASSCVAHMRCSASLRRLLLRLFEAIAPRTGVAIQLALDRRAINAKLARDGGLREAALRERINLATVFVGQMVIAFGHMSSEMWCPTRGVSIWPSETRHAQHEKCGWLKGGPQGCSLRSHRRRRLAPLPPSF